VIDFAAQRWSLKPFAMAGFHELLAAMLDFWENEAKR
jgi:hypothetical protein